MYTVKGCTQIGQTSRSQSSRSYLCRRDTLRRICQVQHVLFADHTARTRQHDLENADNIT